VPRYQFGNSLVLLHLQDATLPFSDVGGHRGLTMRMSREEERVNGAQMWNRPKRAPPHWLSPLAGGVCPTSGLTGKPHASISM
jgi:hypothetical protein